MAELAKWVWIITLIIFFVGTDIFYILGISLAVGLIIYWFKPEWLQQS